MNTMKILNLYSGIGGNRKLWGGDLDITAIEYDESIAEIYKDLFPGDNVIVCDAHEYLLKNFDKYDLIWSSPPCQTHSSFRQNICVRYRGTEPKFPDLKLYEEIIFLQYNSNKLWVVENVKPYYKPLIEGKLIQRHLFWSNFNIPSIEIEKDNIRKAQIPDLQRRYGYDLGAYKLKNKRQILRNCVHPNLGEHVLRCAKEKLYI